MTNGMHGKFLILFLLVMVATVVATAQANSQNATIAIAVVDAGRPNYGPRGGRGVFVRCAKNYAQQQGYTVLLDSHLNDTGFKPVLWARDPIDITQVVKNELDTNPTSCDTQQPASQPLQSSAKRSEIAWVDLDRAEHETTKGAALEATFKPRADRLHRENAEMATLENEAILGKLSPADQESLVNKIKINESQFEQERSSLTNDQNAAYALLDADLLAPLPEYALQIGYTIVLATGMDSRRILWATNGITRSDLAANGKEITSHLVSLYNLLHGSEPIAQPRATSPNTGLPVKNANRVHHEHAENPKVAVRPDEKAQQPTGVANGQKSAVRITPRWYSHVLGMIWKLFQDNLGAGIAIVVALLLLALLPSRLTLLLLAQDFSPINKLAPWFYSSRIGHRKLFKMYRRIVLENPDFREASLRFIDLPFDCVPPLGTKELSETILELIGRNRRVAIVAEGGRGKTALCSYIAFRTIVNSTPGVRRLEPVVIDGVSYAKSFIDMLVASLNASHAYVNSAIVESLLSDGSLLVIFDGFSEIREAFREAAESSDIPRFIDLHPNTPFLFTSRSPLPPEVRSALKSPATIELKDIDKSSEKRFLSKYLKHGEDEVSAVLLQMRERLGQIPKTPLMLKLVAELYDRTGSVPANLPVLLSDYSDHLLRFDVTRLRTPGGLKYALRILTRGNFLESGGDRGFASEAGISVLGAKERELSGWNLNKSPRDILDLLCSAGVIRENMDYCRFFHDSFESYFGASALLADFRLRDYCLIAKSKSNERLKETWDFFVSMLDSAEDLARLSGAVASGSSRGDSPN